MDTASKGSVKHPFTKGQNIRCIRAPERGIPITEDATYTVKWTFVGHQGRMAEDPIPGMENTPGVELVERPGDYFTADRFEATS